MPSQPKLQTILIFGDVHRPFHSERAWNLFLKVGKALKPHRLICMGDFIDAYSVSSHSKDPRRALQMDTEIEDALKGLDELDALGAKEKDFIAGNHSDRLQRYLQDKAPELFSLIDIPKLLKLEERGWSYTPYKSHMKVGKMHFTHDVGSSGRNATFKALDTYQHSICTGHSHRLQFIVEGNMLGEVKLSAQFGWLGDSSKVDYMHRANVLKNWALGFGYGYHDLSTDLVYLTPVPIIVSNDVYSCMVNGTIYRG